MIKNEIEMMIGNFREINDECLLERLIEKYDEDASYKDAYLVVQNELEGNVGGDVMMVLDYGTSFTVFDVDGNGQTYDEDDVAERITEIDSQEIKDFLNECNVSCNPEDYRKMAVLAEEIYNTIVEYSLDKEKFLKYFITDEGDIDYDVVEFFERCLERDEITRFITGNY